jgi:hypothetical protein
VYRTTYPDSLFGLALLGGDLVPRGHFFLVGSRNQGDGFILATIAGELVQFECVETMYDWISLDPDMEELDSPETDPVLKAMAEDCKARETEEALLDSSTPWMM